MMKEIVNFLKWQWNKFEFWQKCFVGSSFFVGSALVAPSPYNLWLSYIPMIVVFGFLTKWMIWDGVRSSWLKYKQERNSLLTTIKQSDQ
jgi:hypothetical protein